MAEFNELLNACANQSIIDMSSWPLRGTDGQLLQSLIASHTEWLDVQLPPSVIPSSGFLSRFVGRADVLPLEIFDRLMETLRVRQSAERQVVHRQLMIICKSINH